MAFYLVALVGMARKMLLCISFDSGYYAERYAERSLRVHRPMNS